MLLYLIRHGETEFNLQGRVQGQMDTPLTSLGRMQAEAIAERMSGIKLDALYTSDLERAYNTAKTISGAVGIDPIKNNLLRERNFGVLQGLTRAEAMEKFPKAANDWRKNDPSARIPEGESTLDVIARCSLFINEIIEKHADNSVIAAVCHGGSLRGMVLALIGVAPELGRMLSFANASLSLLEIGSKKCIHMLNDTCHVDAMELTEKDEDNA